MSQKQLLTIEVLYAWLESVMGAAKRVYPTGYDKSESSGAHADTCRRAACIVESLPAYNIMRWRLIEYLQGGEKLYHADKMLIEDFEYQLGKYLMQNPFYQTTASDLEESAKVPVVHRTVESVAGELGVKPDALRMRLNRLDISLPHGSFRDDKKKWHIHPYDVIYLKNPEKLENKYECFAS